MVMTRFLFKLNRTFFLDGLSISPSIVVAVVLGEKGEGLVLSLFFFFFFLLREPVLPSVLGVVIVAALSLLFFSPVLCCSIGLLLGKSDRGDGVDFFFNFLRALSSLIANAAAVVAATTAAAAAAASSSASFLFFTDLSLVACVSPFICFLLDVLSNALLISYNSSLFLALVSFSAPG